MKWPLYLLTNFGLMFAFSDMNWTTPTCSQFTLAWNIFFHLLHRWQMIESCFLTQYANLCLFMGNLKSLLFRVIIDRYLVFPVI
jgi:hypothetical protein